MVDYSKWANFGDSESDNEEQVGPAVYRVEKGGSINIPGRNVTITSAPGAVVLCIVHCLTHAGCFHRA